MANWNAKQCAFVEHYLVTNNAAEAARRAGYSKKTANAQAWRMMRYRHVADEIARRRKEMSEKLNITAEDIRKELMEALAVAKASVKPLLNSKTSKQIRDEDGNPVYTVNLPAWLRACELLGKSIGMFSENIKMKMDVDQDLIERLQAGRARVAAGRGHEKV